MEQKEFKNYTVRVRWQFPSWDLTEGLNLDVSARSKQDAVKQARKEMEHAGHSMMGLVWYKAQEEI